MDDVRSSVSSISIVFFAFQRNVRLDFNNWHEISTHGLCSEEWDTHISCISNICFEICVFFQFAFVYLWFWSRFVIFLELNETTRLRTIVDDSLEYDWVFEFSFDYSSCLFDHFLIVYFGFFFVVSFEKDVQGVDRSFLIFLFDCDNIFWKLVLEIEFDILTFL